MWGSYKMNILKILELGFSVKLNFVVRERERGRRESGVRVVRDITFRGDQEHFFPALNDSSQWLLVKLL
jgi:hypothetical protein